MQNEYGKKILTDPDDYQLETARHEPIIRARSHADLGACVVALEAVHKFDGYPSSWPSNPNAWLTPDAVLQAWVARISSSIVGHIAVGEIDPIKSPHFVGRGREFGEQPVEIKRLFVVPHARGLGIARALLHTAVAYARAKQFHPVLEVTADREAAIQLYERAGWRYIGTAPAGWRTASGERPWLHRYELVQKDNAK